MPPSPPPGGVAGRGCPATLSPSRCDRRRPNFPSERLPSTATCGQRKQNRPRRKYERKTHGVCEASSPTHPVPLSTPRDPRAIRMACGLRHTHEGYVWRHLRPAPTWTFRLPPPPLPSSLSFQLKVSWSRTTICFTDHRNYIKISEMKAKVYQFKYFKYFNFIY